MRHVKEQFTVQTHWSVGLWGGEDDNHAVLGCATALKTVFFVGVSSLSESKIHPGEMQFCHSLHGTMLGDFRQDMLIRLCQCKRFLVPKVQGQHSWLGEHYVPFVTGAGFSAM